MTMPDQESTATPACTVYFDGSCALCRREIALYRTQSGAEAVAFIDVSKADAACGPDLTRDEAMARFHVREADGRLIDGAAGFVALWASLPGWRWLARLARGRRRLIILEWLYRRFLVVRPWLSRQVGRLDRRAPSIEPR
jgi:predicted DCC family thiol-disulfide oxidoreductase YuxK